jgi:hypothetical protein
LAKILDPHEFSSAFQVTNVTLNLLDLVATLPAKTRAPLAGTIS